MTVESVKTFFEEVSQNESLQAELAVALEAENDRQAVTELAQSKGYSFSSEELWQEVQARQAELQRRQEAGELSDEELESVAGGETSVIFGVTMLASYLASLYGSHAAAKSKW